MSSRGPRALLKGKVINVSYSSGLSQFSRRHSALLLSVLCIILAPLPGVPAHAGSSWQIEGSFGYLFVSDAEGPPWFSDTAFPAISIGYGGGSWLAGVSADYARNETSYEGFVPGHTMQVETVEQETRNSSFRAFLRFYPGGRERTVATYLGVGLGPAVTTVEHAGAFTGLSASDTAVRLSYLVSLGAKVRLSDLPLHTFLEGSYGGLGRVSEDGEDSATVPGEDLSLVGVAAGLGVSF